MILPSGPQDKYHKRWDLSKYMFSTKLNVKKYEILFNDEVSHKIKCDTKWNVATYELSQMMKCQRE